MAAALLPKASALLQHAAASASRNIEAESASRPEVRSMIVSFPCGNVSFQKNLGFQGLTLQAEERRSNLVAGQSSYRHHVGSIRSGAGVADEQDQNDSSFQDFPPVPEGRMMVPMMKKGFGAYGGGATLEKSKLDLSTSQTKTSPQLDMGSGGGKGGKGIFNGGGDGGDDGGDDDDYFGEDDDGDDGDDNGFIRRGIISELFDRASIEAVLQEWFKTIGDLPSGLYRAVEMGLVSSALLARFMSMDARPTVARIVSRMTPQEISRAFIGRMMADPSFIYKVVLEQGVSIGAAAAWEVKQRGDRLKDEWDLALANVFTLAVCNLAVVWSLSPSRSYGTTARSDWQLALQKLPNHVFDKSYPLREFNMQSRIGSFFYKAAELSFFGSAVGAAGGALSNALLKIRQDRTNYSPSVPAPSTGTTALAYGSYAGLSGNLRYQLVYGLERLMQQNLNHIPLAILGSTALRVSNVFLAEPSRLAWLGVDSVGQAVQERQQKAYRRPSLSSVESSLKNFSVTSLTEQLFGRRKARKPRAKSTKKEVAAETTSEEETKEAPKRPRRKIKRKVVLAE